MAGIFRSGPFIAGLLAVALRLALLPVLPVPVPLVQDEFSYLLGAETFASGRLTNPTPPLCIHFETMHENFQPTYHSKYPPGQSLLLAFGMKFLGHPWFGVVLGMGLMFAAICWALEGWIRSEWALTTTILSILMWGVTGYWMNSYWGGAVAAIGGALVTGAIARLARDVRLPHVLLAALGIVLLANSRPFEGGLTIIGCALVLIWWRRREKRPFRALLTARVLVTAMLVLAPGAGAMAYYNYRLTGSATLLPYVLNERRYASSPRFYLAGPIREPSYNHDFIRRNWDWDRALYQYAHRNPLIPIVFVSNFTGSMWILGFCLVGFAGVVFGPRPRAFAATTVVGLPLIGILFEKAFLPHYFAPMTAAYLVLAGGLLEVSGRWRKALITAAAIAGLGIFGVSLHRDATYDGGQWKELKLRPQVIRSLESQGGQHLILIRYTPAHSIHQEWVYNHADIDRSDVIWARDMGREKNRELIDHYPNRKVWLLEPDHSPLAVAPYRPD